MNKFISIIGAGESGIGAAILAKKNSYNVFVSDNNKIKTNYREVLIKNRIDFEEGGHSSEKILKSNLIIKSPGIPNDNELIKIINNQLISMADPEMMSMMDKKDKKKDEDNGKSDAVS